MKDKKLAKNSASVESPQAQPEDKKKTEKRDVVRGVHVEELEAQLAEGNEHDLSGQDFVDKDLRGLRIKDKTLFCANFSKANLSHAEIKCCKLPKSNFEETNLEKATLQETHFDGANLERANLSGTLFEKVRLLGARLSGARLNNTCFNDTALPEEEDEDKEKYLRLAAEFENYRKRQQRDTLRLQTRIRGEQLRAFFSILDDLARATEGLKGEKEDLETLKKGLDLVIQKCKNHLESEGVKEIPAQKGDIFDADIHEAVAQAPAPKEELRGRILAVIEKGYRTQQMVLRYAKVQTASHE